MSALSFPTPTMSSREIADLTGKPHKHVIRDVRVMIDELEKDGPNLGHEDYQELKDARDYTAEFRLNRRLVEILVTGYSIHLRAKVIDRLHELEAQASDPLQALNDPATMRGLLLTYTEKVIALENQVVELTPKAQALERISGAEGGLNITESAKALHFGPKKMFQRLHAMGWIYRRPGGKQWLGYQDKVSSGYLDHRITTIQMPDGTERVCEQVQVTPKGLAKLAAMLTNGGDA